MKIKEHFLSKQDIDNLPAIKLIWDFGIKVSLFKWMLWIILQGRVNEIMNSVSKYSLVDKKQNWFII